MLNDIDTWTGLVEIPDNSLGGSEDYLEDIIKELFMQSMHKMLRWVPEERQGVGELLTDLWLNS